jgi:HNH endonuclease/NUMOD4 motif
MREWRDVQGLEDRYEVSNDGLVRAKPRILKPGFTHDGYPTVNIGGRTKYVHRLVAEAFLDNPQGKRVVNHKNGDRADSRLSNLEWATHSENNTDAYARGRTLPRADRVIGVSPDGQVIGPFASIRRAAESVGVQPSAVSSALRRHGSSAGYVWAYV